VKLIKSGKFTKADIINLNNQKNISLLTKNTKKDKVELNKAVSKGVLPKKVKESVFDKTEGTYKIPEKPKTFIEKLTAISNKNIQKAHSLKTPHGERIFRGLAVAGVLGLGRGFYSVYDGITNPIQYAKQTFEAIVNPVQTIKATGKQFSIDPVGTIAEFYAFGKTVKTGGKVVKDNPVARTVREEVFIRTQPKEIRRPVRKILEASKVQEKLNPQDVKKMKVKDLDFAEIKSMTKKEGKALKKTLGQTDSVLFGSLPARAISNKKTPVPKDVDLATSNINTFTQKFLKNIPKKQRKNYALKGEKVVRKSNGEALFDIKPLNRLIPDRSLLTRRGRLPVSGYVREIEIGKGSVLPRLKKKAVQTAFEVKTQKLEKIGDIKLTGFGEQTLRKGLGTLQVLIERNSRRAKDPRSFVIQLKVQLDALKNTKPKTPLGKLRKSRAIKKLQSAIDLLLSKEFARLLDKKVPGLTKEFPLVAGIDSTKLKKVKKSKVNEEANKKIIEQRKTKKKKSTDSKKRTTQTSKKKAKKSTKKKTSKLPKSKSSKLPKTKSSKLPKSRSSKLPKAKSSKLPKSKSSRLPKAKISKLPPGGTSRLPPGGTSRLPPGGTSRLPPGGTSRLPPRIIRGSTQKKPPIRFDDKKKNKLKSISKKAVASEKFIYIPDLYSRVFDIKASKKEKAALQKVGRLFTGLERRKKV